MTTATPVAASQPRAGANVSCVNNANAMAPRTATYVNANAMAPRTATYANGQMCAWVSNGSPSQNSPVTVYGQLILTGCTERPCTVGAQLT